MQTKNLKCFPFLDLGQWYLQVAFVLQRPLKVWALKVMQTIMDFCPVLGTDQPA